MRDIVPFSSIKFVTLCMGMGRGNSPAGKLNAQRVHEGLTKFHVIYGFIYVTLIPNSNNMYELYE